MNNISYSTNALLHSDRPEYGFIFRIILMIPLGMLAGSLYLFFSGEAEGSLFLVVEACIIGLIFWLVFPREYRVYEDHLRIVLGGPFSVKVGFQDIKSIEVTRRTGATVNWVTRVARQYVEIARKRSMSIAITPADNDLFVENANRALEQWIKRRGENTPRQTR